VAARERRRRGSGRSQRNRGPPPGRPRPARSRPGAAGGSIRRKSRLREITPTPSVPMALERRPRRPGGGRRAHRVRSTHASDTAGAGAARAGGRRDCPAAGTAVTGRRAASAAGHLGATRRRCGAAAAALRPATTRQTGQDEAWVSRARGPGSDPAVAASPGRATAAHEAARTRTQRISHAPRTSQNRPRWTAERSAVTANAAATTPSTGTVGAAPSASAAARIEVPASTDRPQEVRRPQAGWAAMRPNSTFPGDCAPFVARQSRSSSGGTMPPLTQSTRRRRRMTHGDGRCARIEHEQHWRADRGESGLGAGVAHGAGAHLLGMKEGIIAEVPARSQLACATHGGAGVHRVVC